MKRGWMGLALASAVLSVGCGGGGGKGTGGPGGGGSETNFGAIGVTALGQLKSPVVITSPGYTLSGFSGATITSAVVNYPAVTQATPEVMMENSTFAASMNDHPTMLNLLNGFTFPLGTAGISDSDTQPSVYPTGPRVATSEWSPADNAHHIFSTHRDGTGRVQLTSGSGVDYREPAYSNSAGMIFVNYTAGEGRLFRLPNGSTTPVAIYDDAANYQRPKLSADGSTVYFVRVDGDGIEYLMKAPADGSGTPSVVFTLSGPGRMLISVMPTGEVLTATEVSGNTTFFRVNPDTSVAGQPIVISGTYSSIAAAPDGVTVILSDGTSSLYRLSLATSQVSDFVEADGDVDTISWGPYERQRYLIGPNSWNTPQAAGFLITQLYSHVGSYVTYDATTPADVTVTPHQGGNLSSTLVVTVEAADELTSLKYTASGVSINPLSVVIPSRPVKGAIVSFNAEDGHVASIITYSSSSLNGGLARAASGNTLTFKGKFESVWDGKGKNTHPNGATTVKIDAKTGALISAE
ncbi:MAG: TolB family protein [Fimbriimonas sp.]